MTPTEKALLTWYKPDNPLYKNPEHPTIKLAGEVGELMDLYGKHTYKPGFNWMRCKQCKKDKNWHNKNNAKYKPWTKGIVCFRGYTSIVLDELGDIWYYLRIMAWIYDVELETQLMLPDEIQTYFSIRTMYINASNILLNSENISYSLKTIFQCLNQLLINLDYTLDELTELNYVKLNSDNTNHGWKNAR